MWKGGRKALRFPRANPCLIAMHQWVCIGKAGWNWMHSYNNAQHSCSRSLSANLYQRSLSKLYPRKHARDELFGSMIWECNPVLSETERGTFYPIPLGIRSRESLTMTNTSVSPKVVSCPRKGIQHSKEEWKPQHSIFCHPNARWNDNSPPSTRIPSAFLYPFSVIREN